MIIYTNLKEGLVFSQLNLICKLYNIVLRQGVNTEWEVSHDGIILFWIAKSNRQLSFYRAKESVEKIYEGLKVLDNNKELIK